MSRPQPLQECPYCAEWIPARATRCRHCGEDIDWDEFEEEPEEDQEDGDGDWEDQRPRTMKAETGVTWLAPVQVTGRAIAAGYLGIFSLFPVLGLLLGPLAILFGYLGLFDLAANPNHHGRFRCWFAIVVGSISTLFNGLLAVVFLVERLSSN